MQFDQQYLDHLQNVVAQAREIVEKAIPLYSGRRSEENYADRTALRKVALDNLLVTMLEVPLDPHAVEYTGPFDPKSAEGQRILDKYAPPQPGQDLEDGPEADQYAGLGLEEQGDR